MRRVLVVVACIAGTTSRAVADSSPTAYLSVPITLGATTRDDGRFAYGVRPELIFAPHRLGFAIGPYGEIARSSADTSVGTGLTLVYYTDSNHPLAVAPSAGVYHRFGDTGGTGYALSLFAGMRGNRGLGVADVPIGIRLDGTSHEFVVSASIDTLVVLGFVLIGIIHRA